MKKSVLSLVLASTLALSLFTGCSSTEEVEVEVKSEQTTTENANQSTTVETTTDVNVDTDTDVVTRIAGLKGATTIGLVDMMDEHSDNEEYVFEMYTASDEVVSLIAKGEIDIALIPANLGATLYQKLDGGVQVIDLNTLNVLDVITGDTSIETVEDLKGKTIYMTGKGTTPEYALTYVLDKNGITMQDLTIEFKTEATEVVAVLADNPNAIAVLPHPFATVAVSGNEAVQSVFDLGTAWTDVATDGSEIVTGVTIARTEFIEENPELIMEFLEEHEASVNAVNENPAEASLLVEQYGIVAAAVAEKAIPNCDIVCITGEEMQTKLSGYLEALYELSPDTIGGQLPDEAFYYMGQ